VDLGRRYPDGLTSATGSLRNRYQVRVVAQRRTLHEGQVALLRWIAEGCPDGVMEGHFYRISASALRSKGLVKISGHGSTWTAKPTMAGQEYLEQLEGDDPPVPRQANVSVIQRLVDDVIGAGGSMRVPRYHWYAADGVDYERRAHLAERHRKVPPGKRFQITRLDRELEITLVDSPFGAMVPKGLTPVPVPEKVGRHHAAARQFRDRKDRHEVSRALVGRATRVIHAIATEARLRGWEVSGPGPQDGPGSQGADLVLLAGGHTLGLRLFEEGVHPRGVWEEEVRRHRNVSSESSFYRNRTFPRGPYDADATGRLRLELLAGNSMTFAERQWRWGDRASWMLEERLPHLFREIEERIVIAKEATEVQRIEAERAAERARLAAEERERNWLVLMDQAKQKLVEAHRAKQLREQASAFAEIQGLRSYVEAMEAAYGDHEETAPWLAWAQSYIDQRDPLGKPPVMPRAPEATPEALQAHLPSGWSADGPREGTRHSPAPHQRY